eukprot:5714589-Prymnesium_polylepis.1
MLNPHRASGTSRSSPSFAASSSATGRCASSSEELKKANLRALSAALRSASAPSNRSPAPVDVARTHAWRQFAEKVAIRSDAGGVKESAAAATAKTGSEEAMANTYYRH